MQASKLRRLINWLVDIGCILFLFLGFLRLLPAAWLPPREYLRWVAVGVSFAYYFLAEVIFHRTMGQLITGTLVVTKEDENPSFKQLAIRTFCRFLPLEPLSIFFSKQARGWHDLLSGTKVVFLNY